MPLDAVPGSWAAGRACRAESGSPSPNQFQPAAIRQKAMAQGWSKEVSDSNYADMLSGPALASSTASGFGAIFNADCCSISTLPLKRAPSCITSRVQ